MRTSVVYVGLDVHKDSIAIAVAREGREPAETWKTIPYDGVRLRKALKMLVKSGELLKVCYEAGPTGFGMCRRLRKEGIEWHRKRGIDFGRLNRKFARMMEK